MRASIKNYHMKMPSKKIYLKLLRVKLFIQKNLDRGSQIKKGGYIL